MRSVLLIASFGVLAASCFNPQIAAVRCSPGSECPVGLVCDMPDRVCRAPSTGPDANPDGTPTIDDPVFRVAHLDEGITDFGTTDLIGEGTITIDTTAGIVGPPFNLNLTSVAQTGGGPQTSLLVVRSLELKPGATIEVRGTRGLIIVVEQAITIAGHLDASAVGIQPGPGSDGLAAGVAGGSDGVSYAAGGGGGFGTAGGNGGDTENAGGGAGGEPFGDASLGRLAGGSEGGGGALGISCERRGGGGGGAIQLSSTTDIFIAAAATISAGGGGGQPGGPCPGGAGGPGGGGGSGGSIYVQARDAAIAGALIANGGGGGGGGGDDNGQDGSPGSNGSARVQAANGGNGGDDSGDGGRGGGLAGLAANGQPADSGNGGGGGGGGGGGRIAIDANLDAQSVSLISPAAIVLP